MLMSTNRFSYGFLLYVALPATLVSLSSCQASTNEAESETSKQEVSTPTSALTQIAPFPEENAFIPPSRSGAINVQEAPYFAKGDGVTDDTEAIQRAIAENIDKLRGGARTLYFPAGIYLISQPLEWKNEKGKWRHSLVFQGAGRGKTIFRLADNSPAYQSAESPKPVIATGGPPFVGRKNLGGGGNQSFNNHLYDFTVDTGSGNPGAIGVDYTASNIGSIMRLDILSGDGQGFAGLVLNRHIGPACGRLLRIEGFDYGIYNGPKGNRTGTSVDLSVPLEHIQIKNPRKAGIFHTGTMALRDLEITAEVPAIINETKSTVLVVDRARLISPSSSEAAIMTTGPVFLRDVEVQGYVAAIADIAGAPLYEGDIVEYAYPDAFDPTADTAGESLRLEVPAAPYVAYPAPDKWTLATDLGAFPDDTKDDSVILQQAIDSGVEYLLLPTGLYRFDQPLIIRGNLKILQGMKSKLMPVPGGGNLRKDPTPHTGFFSIEGGHPNGVKIERFRLWGDREVPMHDALHKSNIPTILEDISGSTILAASNQAPLFIRDFNGSTLFLNQGTVVDGFQLDVESRYAPNIVNDGGILKAFGVKNERRTATLLNYNGAQTEILAGVSVANWAGSDDNVVFINENADLSASFAAKSHGGYTFEYVLEDLEGNKIVTAEDERVARHNQSWAVGLMNLRQGGDSENVNFEPKLTTSPLPENRPGKPFSLVLDASYGVTTDQQQHVYQWENLAKEGEDADAEIQMALPLRHRPTYLASGINGKPAVAFDGGDFMDFPINSTLHRFIGDAPFTAYVAFEIGPDISRRQVILLQGAKDSAVSLYVQEGNLVLLGYNKKAKTPWGPVTLKMPVEAETVYAGFAQIDPSNGRMTLAFNQQEVSEKLAIGPLGSVRHFWTPSIGAAFSIATYHFPEYNRAKRVFGGRYFFKGKLAELWVATRPVSPEQHEALLSRLQSTYETASTALLD